MKALLFLVSLMSAHATDPLMEGPGLEIDLISENRSITPGQAFTVGLHIHHFPGFHTYWKNPGQVGVPTSLDWDLPEGFLASEISWPYPENSFMGEYPCHGYERDVTLLVTITPPKKIVKEKVTLKADAIWMCCAKGCFPGFQTFTMTLPVSTKPVPDATASAHISKARSELPKVDAKVKATLLSEPDAKMIRVLIEGESGEEGEGTYFFSTDGQISSNQKQKFTRHKGGLLFTVPRSEFSPEEKTTLPGVLKIGRRHLKVEARPKI